MRIGVIGGNGVAATNRLCEMVERKTTAAGAFRDAHHLEMLVWQATSVPSRSMFLEGRGPDWRPDYIRIAKQFKDLGCERGCMCCNTAHYAVDEIAAASGLRFVNLLDEVAQRASKLGHKHYELFCSDGACKFDIYGAAFRRICPDVELLYPSEERQKEVTRAICAVKTKCRLQDRMADHPWNILLNLIQDASAPVIFGCTDLRVAYNVEERLPEKVAIDSLEVLADVVCSLNTVNTR